MRIVIDLQGAQSTGSRNRGVGRYSMSLAQAIIRNKGPHEVIVALNGIFADTIEPIRSALDGVLAQDAIRVWNAPGPVGHSNASNHWRRRSAELVREAFLASLAPDIVLISSLFEALDDDAVTSIGMLNLAVPTAVIFYDLIPYIHRHPYLENPVIEAWYENKLDHVRRANLLLAISESSRQEGIQYLGFPADKIVNISTAADPHFVPKVLTKEREEEVRKRYGLDRQFVMYTGGIDYRKNVEGLIRAFSRLPKKLRANHQLAVVCSAQSHSKASLKKLAKDHGLAAHEVVLTGFVPEDDLLALYNICKMFVFPSWHEGFGLPALEAMRCGKAVIGANTSSLPEVIGRADALFDPHSDESIASKITQVLTDDDFRHRLELHGLKQGELFSWDASAKASIAALEDWHATNAVSSTVTPALGQRLKLAYVSPLRPERSGISNYSAELLPELARHYDIEVITAQGSISDSWVQANCAQRGVEWFRAHADHYDRVLYHFGNNHLHQHMFDLIGEVPGVVVMHDFFLSGVIRHMDLTGYAPGMWDKSLYKDHGYAAVHLRYHGTDNTQVIWKYPNNKDVLAKARGVIVHAENSRRLAERWYGSEAKKDLVVIPHLRTPVVDVKRTAARTALGIDQDAFVVCSFGFLSPTKLNKNLLDAWLSSDLARSKNCLLFFVGENNGEAYGVELLKTIENHKSGERVSITGWIDTATFHQYLAAADLGVQLRTLSRGESSGAVMDCMNYGLATIVNGHGSFADLPEDAVWKLPDIFAGNELVHALETLWRDTSRREGLGGRAREIILTSHAPRACADGYAQAIESMYRSNVADVKALAGAVSTFEPGPTEVEAWVDLANALAYSIPSRLAGRQLLVDVSKLIATEDTIDATDANCVALRELLAHPPKGFRVEPIYIAADCRYFYARKFTLRLIGCPDSSLEDEVIEYAAGDVLFGLFSDRDLVHEQDGFFQKLREQGVKILFYIDEAAASSISGQNSAANWPPKWSNIIARCDGVIGESTEEIKAIEHLLPVICANRLRPLYLGAVHAENSSIVSALDEVATGELDPSADWSQDTKKIVDALLNDNWMTSWVPDGGHRYFGSDSRLGTQVGERDGRTMRTTQKAGVVLHGPYLALSAGRYRVNILGQTRVVGSPEAYADIAVRSGKEVLSRAVLGVSSGDGLLAELDVYLDTGVLDFEVRIWAAATSDLTVTGLEILPEGLFEKSLDHESEVTSHDASCDPREAKIGWVTTWNTKCGIATYSEHLISNMAGNVTVFAAEQVALLSADDENCYRFWKTSKEKNDLEKVARVIDSKNLNVIVIQFNYGFFNFLELTEFVDEQLDADRVVIFMMHSTVDPYGETQNWRLSELKDILSRCHRVLVHSDSDRERLKKLDIVDNVRVFPHGVLSYGAVPSKDAPSDMPLIAAYGFCLPHKGLKELIEAVFLLKQRGAPVRLRLVNAEYPNPVSTELLKELKSLVEDLSLEDTVEFHNDYLEDVASLALLADSDLLVFPYQVTGESSSAAVRYGLATKRPVAVTPLGIFEDLGESVFHFAGVKPADIAQGIAECLDDIRSNSPRAQTIHREADRWRVAHDYRVVGSRLQDICTTLLSDDAMFEKI
ncbi:glycosyltransferase [Paraburkholderia sediminicola]|uniref:glycosyltransferase n=1 Tax=Paraburkholderia sediminicola TaxID=458836 RepID=UPI0038BB1929